MSTAICLLFPADVYSSLESNDRVGDGKGPVVERDALQVICQFSLLNANDFLIILHTASFTDFITCPCYGGQTEHKFFFFFLGFYFKRLLSCGLCLQLSGLFMQIG